MLSGIRGGSSITSGGSAGRSSHDHWPTTASQIRVKTRVASIPPCWRMKRRAPARWGASAGAPASRSATYASTVVDRSPGPPWKFAHVPSSRWRRRIQPAAASAVGRSRMPRTWRSNRSSASIVTLVSSSPFHQPAGAWRPNRWSRARANASCAPEASGGATCSPEAGAGAGVTLETSRAIWSELPLDDEPGEVGELGAGGGCQAGALERAAGGVEMAPGQRLGGAPASEGVDQLGAPGHGAGVERAVGEQVAQLPRGRSPGAERVDDRERLLAGGQVVAAGLPGPLRVTPDAQQVVDRLERHPEVGAVAAQGGHHGVR